MNTSEVITLPLGRERLLGSGSSERPAVVSRLLNLAEEEPREAITVWRMTKVATMSEVERPPRRIPRLMPSVELPAESFSFLEKWDGVVISVDTETFEARLYSTGGKRRTMLAEFSKAELSPEERGQIVEGAVFVWTIGYRNVGTTRYRDSVIYFRRLPAWDEQELAAGTRHGAALTESIGWE
jgi:hypothetical protein